MAKKSVTIWHNPRCSTSRAALARLEERGIEPDIYLYLEEKPSKAQIVAVLKQAKLKPSQALRQKEGEGEALSLYDDGVTEEEILSGMMRHPILIQRPIVIGPKGAVLARPVEKIDEVL